MRCKCKYRIDGNDYFLSHNLSCAIRPNKSYFMGHSREDPKCHLIFLHYFVNILIGLFVHVNAKLNAEETWSTITATAERIAMHVRQRWEQAKQSNAAVGCPSNILGFCFPSIHSISFRHVDSYCCLAQRDAPHSTQGIRTHTHTHSPSSQSEQYHTWMCCERLVVIIMRLKVI